MTHAHTEPLFKAPDLLKIQDMLHLSTLEFYYRYVHDNLPAYFYSFRIVTQVIHHNYDTRYQIRIDRTRTRYADKRVRIYFSTVLNSTQTALLDKMHFTVSRVSHLILKILHPLIFWHLLHPKLLHFSSYLDMLGNCRNMCNISLFVCSLS